MGGMSPNLQTFPSGSFQIVERRKAWGGGVQENRVRWGNMVGLPRFYNKEIIRVCGCKIILRCILLASARGHKAKVWWLQMNAL
jgi:hypothetical protein